MAHPDSPSAVTVFVQGIPKPQPRAKAFVRASGHAGVYDPKSANPWKERVRAALEPYRHAAARDCAFGVALDFYLPRPKSHYGKTGLRKSAPEQHTGRVDVDNLAKAALDVLTDMGWWRDDGQVVSLTVTKCWSDPAHAGADITIEELHG